MIEYNFEDIDTIDLPLNSISKWVDDIVSLHKKELGELSYIFCSDPYILNINKEYLQHDYYTDIITFNYNENNIVSGDLFISIDTIQSNSELFNTSFSEELFRVIIHGVLHLIGFDDQSEADQEEMTLQENIALKHLKTFL